MSVGKVDKNIPLPANWDIRSLGEVVQPTRPKIKPSEKPDLPFIGMENIEAHTMKLLGTVPAGTMKSSAVHFQSDDVLYGRLRPYLNKVYRPDFEGLCSAEFIVFPKTEGVSSRYLQYFLNSSSFASYATHLNAGDRPRVDFEQLSPYLFPVAPYEQQKRIVAEIEKQFSRLDEAVANLKRVKANLKRYKAAVLKAAVEGKLTEDWRKQHPNVEPASKLIERILAERRDNWKGREKYKELAIDTSNFPVLPRLWTYAPLSSFLIEPMCNGISVKGAMAPPGVPALRLNAMTETGFDYSKVRYIPIDAALAKELEVKTGDFFVSRGNGSLRLVGRGTVAQIPPCQCVFPDTMIRLRIAFAMGASRWISTIWSSELIRRQIEKKVKTTAGIWKISQPELGSILLPVPPEAEQHCIVAEVERRLSVIDELEATVKANLTRADRLRQSILKRAFEGKLVATNQPQRSDSLSKPPLAAESYSPYGVT